VTARRLARFAVVGLFGTGTYYLALLAMVEWLVFPVMLATSCAFLIVTVQNYVLHYRWTFASTNAHRAAFPRFLIMNAAGFVINWTMMFVVHEVLGVHYLLAQAAAIAAVVVWNLTLSTYWIFNATERAASEIDRRREQA
jgi:putative flippase GtrA